MRMLEVAPKHRKYTIRHNTYIYDQAQHVQR